MSGDALLTADGHLSCRRSDTPSEPLVQVEQKLLAFIAAENVTVIVSPAPMLPAVPPEAAFASTTLEMRRRRVDRQREVVGGGRSGRVRERDRGRERAR